MSDKSKRVLSIDFLRGLLAYSVMIYHYLSWSSDGLDASSVFSRFGLYAVTIFYFISGFSLMLVYNNKRDFDIILYFKKRFFRLAPLFYFVSFIFFTYGYLEYDRLDFFKILLNFSFLFSILDPSAYYATGSWSIGNEMFFYLILAFILVSQKKFSHLFFILLFILSLLIYIYYRHSLIHSYEKLSNQWHIYINPLNHLFSFLSGSATYLVYKKYSNLLKSIIVKLILLSFCSLIFLPLYEGDRVNLVRGFDFLFLIVSSYSIFILFLSLNDNAYLNYGFSTFLGNISYSVYLVHPICWFFIKRFFVSPNLFYEWILFWFLSILFTTVVSYLTYRYIELPGMKLGRIISFK